MTNQTLSKPIQKERFRDQGVRRGLAAQNIRLDIDAEDASCKTRVLGKTVDVIN